MGYTTYFNGSMSITPPLSKPQVEYLQAFNKTRRMKRSNAVITMVDEKRVAVSLPLGVDAGYFVGGGGSCEQDKDRSVVSYNSPPSGQPGLWCQWTVDDEGENLMWDENEKFYNYTEWLEYLVEHFLKPWGCELNGQIEWSGENDNDKGVIEAIESNIVNKGPSWAAAQEPPAAKAIDEAEDALQLSTAFEDARLFEAAPDMLKALKQLVDEWDRRKGELWISMDTIDQAVRAIEKAERTTTNDQHLAIAKENSRLAEEWESQGRLKAQQLRDAAQEPPKTAYQQLLDAADAVFVNAVAAGETHENGDWYESWWNLKQALERCNQDPR